MMKKIMYKCLRCDKILFFWQKYYFKNEVYCKSCRDLILIEEEREREELKKKKKEIYKNIENAKRARLKNKLADEKLKIELQKEKEKKAEKNEKKKDKIIIKKDESPYQQKKQNKAKILRFNLPHSKLRSITRICETDFRSFQLENHAAASSEVLNPSRNKLIYFTKEEIEENDKLLFIYVNVKQIHAIEWLNGKKRIVLNKKREVRRTHAGGFSAEKFQKFIDAKKEKTFEWITEVLERQGVLKSSYNKIRISSQNDNLKKQLEEYLQKYLE